MARGHQKKRPHVQGQAEDRPVLDPSLVVQQPAPTQRTRIRLFAPMMREASRWLIGSAALVYATGFLITMAFLDSYGVRENGTDYWRFRYVHVGLLCLSFPAIAYPAAYFLLKSHGRRRLMHEAAIGLIVVGALCCYVFAMFARQRQPGTPVLGLYQLLWLMIAVCACLALLLAGGEMARDPDAWDQRGSVARVAHRLIGILIRRRLLLTVACGLSAAVVAYLCWGVLRCYEGIFRDMCRNRSLMVLCFMLFTLLLALVPIVFGRALADDGDPALPKMRGSHLRVLALCVSAPLYYVLLFSFAHGVFPYISARRGGGDYTDASKVIVYLKGGAGEKLALETYLDPDAKGPLRTRELVLIEATSTGYYLADPVEADGPYAWRSTSAKPRVLFVSRDCIATMRYITHHSITRDWLGLWEASIIATAETLYVRPEPRGTAATRGASLPKGTSQLRRTAANHAVSSLKGASQVRGTAAKHVASSPEDILQLRGTATNHAALLLTGLFYGYKATGSTRLVDLSLDWSDYILTNPAWKELEQESEASSKGTTHGAPAGSEEALQAAILRPIVLMSGEIMKDPELSRRYGARAEALIKASEQAYGRWESLGAWRDVQGGGVWVRMPAIAQQDDVSKTKSNSTMAPGPCSLPTFKQNLIACWLIAMYDATGKPIYRERAEKWWHIMRSRMMLTGEGKYYVWHYWDAAGPWDSKASGSGSTDGRVHPDGEYYAVDVAAITVAYEHGLVFTPTDIERLVATNRDFMWNQQIKKAGFRRIDGASEYQRWPRMYPGSNHGLLWTALVPYDPMLRRIFEANNQPGNWVGVTATPQHLVRFGLIKRRRVQGPLGTEGAAAPFTLSAPP